MKTRSFAATLAAVLLASCSSSVEGPDRAGAGSMAPIVTGIRMTFENGVFIGNWGNPTDGPGDVKPGMFTPGLAVLAPNPCVARCTLRYDLPRASAVRLWISPARLAGSLGGELEPMFGANMAAAGLTTIRTIDSGTMRPAGSFTMDWDGTDDAGNRVPTGFYRIYLSIDDTFYWRDLLFFPTFEEAERFSLKIRD